MLTKDRATQFSTAAAVPEQPQHPGLHHGLHHGLHLALESSLELRKQLVLTAGRPAIGQLALQRGRVPLALPSTQANQLMTDPLTAM